jgi:hypothetical protein
VSDLVGKTVAIAITCVDGAGRRIDAFETHGTIEVVSDDWIGVRREGLAELFGLPPAPELLDGGEGSDYIATLTVRCTDPESILTIRGIGFAPQ